MTFHNGWKKPKKERKILKIILILWSEVEKKELNFPQLNTYFEIKIDRYTVQIQSLPENQIIAKSREENNHKPCVLNSFEVFEKWIASNEQNTVNVKKRKEKK